MAFWAKAQTALVELAVLAAAAVLVVHLVAVLLNLRAALEAHTVVVAVHLKVGSVDLAEAVLFALFGPEPQDNSHLTTLVTLPVTLIIWSLAAAVLVQLAAAVAAVYATALAIPNQAAL